MHPPGIVALGHLLMNDAAARRHPLDVAGPDRAMIAHAVAMLHRSRQNIGDGLDPAMRMPGKAREIILRHVVAEIIQQQKRIEVGSIAETKGAPQMHPGAFQRWFGFDQPLNRSNRHEFLRCDAQFGARNDNDVRVHPHWLGSAPCLD